MADIQRAEDYFRRSKDKSGDEKMLARGLLHLIKHLELTEGRDFGRAHELLDRAWKKIGVTSRKLTAEAMFLVARELKKKDKKGGRVGRVKSSVERDEFGLIKGIVGDEFDED
jgi:hypothetical protein